MLFQTATEYKLAWQFLSLRGENGYKYQKERFDADVDF